VSLHNSPRSFNASQYGLASSVNSILMNSPRTRTSIIIELSIVSSSDFIYSPSSFARSAIFSSRKTSITAIDTASESGLQPNVYTLEPGVINSSTSLSPSTTDTGNTPPPSALPKMYISGSTSSQSHANHLPLRPSPH